MSRESLLGEVERYYSEKVTRHGATPQGVDWNGEAGQNLRFERLLAILDPVVERPSINDYGCGYGGLLDLLLARDRRVEYTGFDLSQPMIEAASARHADSRGARFVSRREDLTPADYTVASGIFNVRLRETDADWARYVQDTIEDMVSVSRRGVAFNALTSHSDAGFMRPDLHYADPAALLDHCLRRYSRNVVLDHDYELYEFTLVVRLDQRPPASQHGGGSQHE